MTQSLLYIMLSLVFTSQIFEQCSNQINPQVYSRRNGFHLVICCYNFQERVRWCRMKSGNEGMWAQIFISDGGCLMVCSPKVNMTAWSFHHLTFGIIIVIVIIKITWTNMTTIMKIGSYPLKGKLDNEWKSFLSRPSGLLKKLHTLIQKHWWRPAEEQPSKSTGKTLLNLIEMIISAEAAYWSHYHSKVKLAWLSALKLFIYSASQNKIVSKKKKKKKEFIICLCYSKSICWLLLCHFGRNYSDANCLKS